MPYKPSYTVPEIIQMRSEGKSYSDIAHHFRISRARVGQIIKKEKERVEEAEKTERLRQQIRASHDLSDLEKKLSVDDLFCILELPLIVTKRFKLSFQWEGIQEMSLRQFMDILIPMVDNPKSFYEVLPAFKIRLIGRKSYAAVVMRLSSLDLGEVFRAEWNERRRRLSQYLIESEGYHRSNSLLYQFCGTTGEATPS